MYNEEFIKCMEEAYDNIIELNYQEQKELINKISVEFNIFEDDVSEYLRSLGIESCIDCLIYNKKENFVEMSTREFICSECLEGSI